MNWLKKLWQALITRITVSRVAKAKEWWFCGRHFTDLEIAVVTIAPVADTGQFATAVSVLQHQGINQDEVLKIFGGTAIRHSDRIGWQALADRLGKTIHFVLCHGEQCGDVLATYTPQRF